MATSVTFDLFARDRASGAFTKVGQAAEKSSRSVRGLSGAFGTVTAGSRGLHTTFGLLGRGAALAAGAAGLGGLIAGFKGVYEEGREAQKVTAQTNAVIKSTGGVAKVSAEQVGALATSISNKVGVDDEAIQSGANLLLTFTAVHNEAGKGNDIFNQATQTITDMTAAMNGGKVTQEGMKTASIQVGKALQDPIKGITALRKVGVAFTDQQVKQIKTMVASGNRLGAQKMILAELNKEFGGSAAAGTNAMQKLGVVFGNIKEQVGAALLPAIDSVAAGLASTLPRAVDIASRVFGRIKAAVLGVFDILVRGNFTKAFREAFHLEEDSPIVDVLFRIRSALQTVSLGVRAMVLAFQDGDRTSDGFVGVMERVGIALRAVSKFVSEHRELLFAMAKGVAAVTAAFAAFRVVMAGVNLVMAINPIGVVIVALGALVGAIVYAYQHSERFRAVVATVWAMVKQVGAFLMRTFTPTFQALGETIQRNVIPPLVQLWAAVQRNMPAFIAFAKFIGGVIVVVGALAAKILGFLLPILVKVAGFLVGRLFGLIAQTVQYFGNLIRAVQAAWGAFQTFLRVAAAAFGAFVSAARTAIRAVVNMFLGMVGTIINGAARAFGWVPKLGDKLKAAAARFAEFRDSVNRALGGVKSRTVTVTARAQIAGGVDRQTAIGTALHRATGGPVWGRGTATSDSIPAMLSKGEHVLTAREVQGFGGHGAVESMRKQVRGFAAGGPVGFNISPRLDGMGRFEAALAAFNKRVDAVTRKLGEAAGLGGFSANLRGVVNFARSQAGKPYVWGAAGPGGYDCSGFVSALINVARGRSPYSRLGNTDTLPWSGIAGGSGAFNIGWFYGHPGHVAATVNGVPMESRGGDGVVVGSRSRGASQGIFSHHGHLAGFARGGRVLPGDPPFDLLDPRGKYYRPGLFDALAGAQRGHTAMYGGGVIREPVLGVGRSGRSYSFGERGPETVTPGARGGTTIVVNLTTVGALDAAATNKIRTAIREALRLEGRPVTV